MTSTSADISSDFDQPNQKQDPDDSGEFQRDPDEFVEYIQNEVTQWLDELRRIKKPDERDGRKLGPLEKSLEVVLEFDSNILMDVARKENRKPNADSDFLNNLQNRVNIWIKAIQKMTETRRQAQHFKNVETRKAFSCNCCIRIKHRLKEMLVTAQDYNQMMEDVQINDLLCAFDLAAVKTAVSTLWEVSKNPKLQISIETCLWLFYDNFNGLNRLDEIHLRYNYSLDFLLDIFTTVLKSPQLGNVIDYDARLSIILQNLFSVIYSRVSMGMLHNDQILLASLLLRIYSRYCGAENDYEQKLEQLTALPPEQVLSSAHMIMSKAFGSEFMQQDKVVNFREIILNEVQCKVPVLLCSTTGYDVSNRVEDLVFELKMDILSIALGSAEGFEQADKALHSTS
ncbi:hypothetical protein niasHS_003964 [Heterodera schachtii]|uniref:Uncharacterized protein n=1 Tax=Heterodera schachtii TaxID=97005 RepID=A0ABD2K3P0_HETSC